MLNRFLGVISALVLIFHGFSGSARAQDAVCAPPYETVTTLFYPDFGSYNIWDSVYGEGKREEKFTSVLPAGEGGALAAGEMRPRPEMNASIMLVRLDERGRPVWEKFHAVGGVRRVLKILPFGEGYAVLANRRIKDRKTDVWIGFFSDQGDLLSQRMIQDKVLDLGATDMTVSADGKELLVSVTAEKTAGSPENPVIEKKAVVYALNRKGEKIFDRAYVLGGDSEILGVSAIPAAENGEGGGYIVAGYFKNAGGKKIGWAMRLTGDGTLVWQQEFGRGLAAQIRKTAFYRKDTVLVFGDVLPVDNGRVGSWLMMLDADSGKIVWQRYFRGQSAAHDYFATDMYPSADGLISVMMMAELVAKKKEDREADEAVTAADEVEKTAFEKELLPEDMSYAHVLTLDPRGHIVGGDAYFYGKNVEVYQMVEGEKRERLIAGYADVPYNDEIDKAFVPYGGGEPEVKVNLPDAPVPDKSLSGIALLKKNLEAQKDKPPAEQVGEVADAKSGPSMTRNGWIVAGEGPKPYNDPCIVETAVLP